ncbi:MAG: hypothetical protein QM538_06960 [Methylacidiphilales bacterium]|nr:hypothetical protein [Candidatus Methylacidiphilales bacterium]
MTFKLSQCSKLRLLALAVAYGQISRVEYVKLRRLQLQAIEFNHPTPSVPPEIIERLSIALSQNYEQPENTNSEITTVMSNKNNQLDITIQRHQSNINVDYGAWDNSYQQDVEKKLALEEKRKSQVSKVKYFIITIIALSGVVFGYIFYSNYTINKYVSQPFKQIINIKSAINSSEDSEQRFILLMQAVKPLLNNDRLINKEYLDELSFILNLLDLETRIIFSQTTEFVDLQVMIEQKREMYKKNKEFSTDEVFLSVDNISNELSQIKLEAFSNQ